MRTYRLLLLLVFSCIALPFSNQCHAQILPLGGTSAGSLTFTGGYFNAFTGSQNVGTPPYVDEFKTSDLLAAEVRTDVSNAYLNATVWCHQTLEILDPNGNVLDSDDDSVKLINATPGNPTTGSVSCTVVKTPGNPEYAYRVVLVTWFSLSSNPNSTTAVKFNVRTGVFRWMRPINQVDDPGL